MQVIHFLYMKKTYINTNEQFDNDLERLSQLNPDFSKSLLIRLSVRFAADQKAVMGMNTFRL